MIIRKNENDDVIIQKDPCSTPLSLLVIIFSKPLP